MKKILLAAALALAATGAYADDACKAKAVDKNGKPLVGAALKSSLTKCCKAESAAQKLKGAAATSHTNKCVSDAMGT
jgi:hypothetical protein